jgi:hypothetical protein
MDPQLNYRKVAEDFRQGLNAASRRFAQKAQRRPRVWLSTALLSGGLAAVVVLLLQIAASAPAAADRLALIALAFLLVALIAGIARSKILFQLAARECVRGVKPGGDPHFLTMEEAGLRETAGQGERLVPWRAVQSVESTAEGVFLYCSDVNYLHIPRAAFASPEHEAEWVAAVRAAMETQATADMTVPAAAETSKNRTPALGAAQRVKSAAPGKLLSSLVANLYAGMRIAALKAVPAQLIRGSPVQLTALVLVTIGVSLAENLLTVGRDGFLAWYNLPRALFFVPLILLLGTLVARLEREPRLLLAVAVGLSSAFVWIDIGSKLVYAAVGSEALPAIARDYSVWAYYAVFAWAVAAVVRFVGGLACGRWLPRVRAAVLAIAVVLIPLMMLPADDLWQENYSAGSSARRPNPAREEVLYRQDALLESALQGLKPQRRGVTDIYFLGLGLYGEQDVFRNEIENITALFDTRFGTAGRSIGLINNPDTVGVRPLATATSLRRALTHIASLMDRDEDVLFLYLTSHGSASHRLSVELWPFEFRQIDPAMLKQALDEEGFKWKVIVVSACYSGGFVDPLKDETTLIITASDAKRTSFGCGNDMKYTYFGEAYFDEALKQTYSFVAAFEDARKRIADRESREKKAPSLPQMFVGAAMADKLASLEAVLAAGPSADPALAAREADRTEGLRAFWSLDERMGEWRETCYGQMAESAPGMLVKKYPNYYGGITPASRQWGEVLNAWETYSDAYCGSFSPPAVERLYAEAWSSRLTDSSLDAAVEFLNSPHGQAFIAARNAADRELTAHFASIRKTIDQRARDRYMQEIQSISARHQTSAPTARSTAAGSADAAHAADKQ